MPAVDYMDCFPTGPQTIAGEKSGFARCKPWLPQAQREKGRAGKFSMS